MKDFLNEEATVGELAGKYPQARRVFEERGIDYCCGGKCGLGKAASDHGVRLDALLAELKSAIEEAPSSDEQEKDWHSAGVTELVDYIVDRHHAFLKGQLPRLAGMMAKVLRAHGVRHGEMLRALQDVFKSFSADLDEHLAKEENILFPLIRQIDAHAHGKGPRPVCHCGSVQDPIRQMQHEHDNAAHVLEGMREITADCTLPDDACNTFAALYDGLKAMENDLHEHIHLENNVLFPRSVELEKGIGEK